MKHNLLGAVSTIALGAACGIAIQTPAQAALFYTSPVTQTVTVPSIAGAGNKNITFAGFTAPVIAGTTVTFDDVQVLATLVKETLHDEASITDSATSVAVGSPTGLTAHINTTLKGLGAVSGIFLPATATLTTPAFVGTVTKPPNVNTVGSMSTAGITLVNRTLLSGLSPFTSSWQLQLSFAGGQGGTVPSDVFTGNDGTATLTVTQSYSYTTKPTVVTTPEPATLAVLGMGLAGLGVIRRRRNKA